MNKKAKIIGMLIGLLLLVAVGSALAKVTFGGAAASHAGGPPIAGDGILPRTTGLQVVPEASGSVTTKGAPYGGHLATPTSVESFAVVSWPSFEQSRMDPGEWLGAGDLPQWLAIGALASSKPWAAAQPEVFPTSFQADAISGLGHRQSHGMGRVPGSSTAAVDNLVAAPVPEPEAYVMLLGGLGLIAAMLRRRKSR